MPMVMSRTPTVTAWHACHRQAVVTLPVEEGEPEAEETPRRPRRRKEEEAEEDEGRQQHRKEETSEGGGLSPPSTSAYAVGH